MKIKFRVFLLMVSLILLTGCLTNSNIIPPFKRHEGKWKGVMQDGKEITLILDSKGYAKFYIDKKSMNPYKSNEIYYAIDYTKEPVYLDIIFYSENEKESIVIRCIVDFLSESMMRFSTDFTYIRPLKFEDNNTIILKKVRGF